MLLYPLPPFFPSPFPTLPPWFPRIPGLPIDHTNPFNL